MFTKFKTDISDISVPDKFTYPFCYTPHPLSVIAAEELQDYLKEYPHWNHDFGIDRYIEGVNIGKMFGVLVVETTEGELGYLCSFSGKIDERTQWPGFVPPIVEMLEDGSFYREGEKKIMSVNRQVWDLEKNPDYLGALKKHKLAESQSTQDLSAMKSNFKQDRKGRKAQRKAAKETLSEEDYNKLEEDLKNISLKQQYDYKAKRKEWRNTIETLSNQLQPFQKQIGVLKQKRLQMSNDLQAQIFKRFQFLNAEGKKDNLNELFKHTAQKIPPSGAGDCAAPRLLQYAYQNNLKPVALAEFWWGQPPKSELRRHGYFYPSCKGKCLPILTHMLQGLPIEEDPSAEYAARPRSITVLWEDECMAVVHKPEGLLSVPGNVEADSVFSQFKLKYPDSRGPVIVHRLDMSTSGLMLVTKTAEAYEILQKQFAERSIKKRYLALLDGIISENRGEVHLPIAPDYNERPRQKVDFKHGKPAHTAFKVLKSENAKTLVYFYPETGRTHQLRIHAAHSEGLNAPICGDDLYGIRSDRLYLQAQKIRFKHPLTGDALEFECPEEFGGI